MKIGDTISIPKGTLVFDMGISGGDPKFTKRVSKATIASFHTLSWDWFVGYNQRIHWMEEYARLFGAPANTQFAHTYPLPEVAAEKQRIHDMLENDFEFVQWGDRMARRALVEVAASAEPKERAITKKTQMVKGSHWRFSREVTILANVEPDRDLRLTKEAAAHIAVGRPYDPSNPYRYTHRMPIFTIPAGTEFFVSGKPKSIIRQPETGIPVEIDEDALTFHIKHRIPDGTSGGRGVHPAVYWGENPYWVGMFTLPYRQIEDAVEAIDIPSAPVYVLRNPQGEYFAGFNHDWATNTDHVRMSKTFSGAKKFDKVANAKASIMSWTGMMENRADSVPPGVASKKKMSLPRDWRLIPIDVVTRHEGDPIDLEEWYVEESFKSAMTA